MRGLHTQRDENYEKVLFSKRWDTAVFKVGRLPPGGTERLLNRQWIEEVSNSDGRPENCQALS